MRDDVWYKLVRIVEVHERDPHSRAPYARRLPGALGWFEQAGESERGFASGAFYSLAEAPDDIGYYFYAVKVEVV